MTRFVVVIPARYASTRFPGKPLTLLAGKPMLWHVHERALASGAAEVIVATDDTRIAAAAQAFGATVVMTRADHPSGTDRIAEVARTRGWSGEEIIVNLQGDAPSMPPSNIRQVAELLARHPSAAMATLCTAIASEGDYRNPHIVKVVMDASGRALYFSRASIPSVAHGESTAPRAWRHLGLYAYRALSLQQLCAAEPCELERMEKLEQLRALWLGVEIRIEPARESLGPDVDIPGDLVLVERYLAR